MVAVAPTLAFRLARAPAVLGMQAAANRGHLQPPVCPLGAVN